MNEQLLDYIKEYLHDWVDFNGLSKETCETVEDGILYGHKELAQILIQRIEGYERALIDVNANQALSKMKKKGGR